MQNQNIFFILIGVIVFIMLFNALKKYKKKKNQIYFARPVMTEYEKKLFVRLKAALPEYHVLSQVAFSALITSNDFKIRSKFNRKVTDFVLIDDDGDVIAIIELDDRSHLTKVEEDKFRDLMLTQAGYKVVRFTKLPTLKEIRKRIIGK